MENKRSVVRLYSNRKGASKSLIIAIFTVVLLLAISLLTLFSDRFVGKAIDFNDYVPDVFNTKFYQSPVRADPDDLLLIPGHGFTDDVRAVYKQVSDKPENLQAPDIPVKNTVSEGNLYVASVTPDSISVLLPKVMKAKQTYAIWVKNPNSVWSEVVLINDPRPLWVTPDTAYATKSFASLSREIKVVGRNLDGGVAAKIRLSGPANYKLNVIDDNNPTTTIEHYAGKAALPSELQAGTYTLQFSRDGETWIDLPDEVKFTVLLDPPLKQRFEIIAQKYGSCKANDNLDDTGCIVQAILDAKKAGGGEVFIPAGTWHLKDPSKTAPLSNNWEGNAIVVPSGVDLIGAGAGSTKVVQTLDWKRLSNGDNMFSVFTLLGNNQIKGIYFHSDGFIPGPKSKNWPAVQPAYNVNYLALGRVSVEKDDPNVIENVIITDNKFSGLNNGKVTGMYNAIGNWGSPLRHIFIVNNQFQAYYHPLALHGTSGNKEIRHFVQNSVIAKNTFYPGDYTEAYIVDGKMIGGGGTIALETYGFQHSDFSDNFIDGSVQGGWRAALFWSMHNNNGPMLISGNKATCIGTKVGDGESIAYDENGNSPGLSWPEKVVAATADRVTVNGKWAKTVCAEVKGNACIWAEEPQGYYREHWVHVVDGKGLGQSRKIVSYTYNAPQVFTVSPAWDVIPDKTSIIAVKRSTWQSYIVDNIVDNRKCIKSLEQEKYSIDSGVLGYAAQTSDSTIEGNQMFESGGIQATPSGQTEFDSVFNGWQIFASEIRNNLIDGEDKCPSSLKDCTVIGGIKVWYGGAAEDLPSVVQVHNLFISHNTIKNSDDFGGGIAIRPSYVLSKITPYSTKNILVFHNNLENMPASGIRLAESHVFDTVLYKNNFKNILSADINDLSTNMVEVNLFCGDGIVTGSEICDDGSAGKCAYGLKSCQACSAQCDGQASGKTSYCGDNICDIRHESTSSCQQDCGNVCPTNDLVSWWNGEGNVDDVKGNNKGYLVGNANFVTGRVGQSFDFDGDKDAVVILDSLDGSLDIGVSDFTLSFWAKLDKKTNGNLVTKGCPSCSNNLGYSIEIGNGGVTPFIRIDGAPDGPQGDSNIFGFATNADLTQWHHYASVFDRDGKLSFYLDGKMIKEYDISAESGSLDNPSDFVIGAANKDGSDSFNGLIDEIAVWKRILTAKEVQAIYDAGTDDMCKVPPPVNLCGNNVVDLNEQCDSPPDNSGFFTKNCNDLGFAGGKIQCTSECKLDTSLCNQPGKNVQGQGTCGNSIIEGNEQCDDPQGDSSGVFSKNCIGLGYNGGLIKCTNQCTFDTGVCNEPICGDWLVVGNEQCDDGNKLDGDGCSSMCVKEGQQLQLDPLTELNKGLADKVAAALNKQLTCKASNGSNCRFLALVEIVNAVKAWLADPNNQ